MAPLTIIEYLDVVENALDFLNVAIDEIKEKPKYSVIHFHTAVEILLKSRLLLEHWTLVWAEPANAEWNIFENGNFRFVTMDAAVNRLKRIVGINVSNQVQAFYLLQNRRNKLIHFHHPDLGQDATGEVISSVDSESSAAGEHGVPYRHQLKRKRVVIPVPAFAFHAVESMQGS